MPQNYRHHHPERSDARRGGRMRSGKDRDRYASGNERRYSPDWDERRSSSGGFEGDRSYSAGGYAEEFGNRRPGSRDLERGQGQRGGDYGSLLRWDEDSTDLGDYYGAGNYYGTHSTQPSARAEGMRAYGGGYFNDIRKRGNTSLERESVSGNYENYGRSQYGAQSGYGRDYGEPSGNQRGYGQDFRESYAEERYGRNQPATDLRRNWGRSWESERGDYEGRGAESPQGTHRGKGPKGYERSDERLKEMVCERLTDDPRIDASDVSIEVKDKVVKLSGTVQDRRSKYVIEDVVDDCGAVKDIENSIRVRPRA